MNKKIFQDPLVLFVLFGALVFFIYASLENTNTVPVELSENNRLRFAQQLQLLTGQEATQKDIKKLEDDYIQEEILFREAIKAGMHLTDPEVRSKLVEEMRYQVIGILPDPSEAKLVQYYLSHIKRYAIEPSISFQHVFFDDKPNADVLSQLSAGQAVNGDEFWQGRVLPNYGISMIRGMFGKTFLDSLQTAPNSVWFGPEQSLLGWHFVKVTNTQSGMPLTFDHARMQVLNDYTVEVLENSVDTFIDKVNADYEIIRHVK